MMVAFWVNVIALIMLVMQGENHARRLKLCSTEEEVHASAPHVNSSH